MHSIPTEDNVLGMSLSLHIIQTRAEYDDDDDQNMWMNSMTDRYKYRPQTEQFSEICLSSVASDYMILSKSESSSHNDIKLEKGLGPKRILLLHDMLGFHQQSIQKRTSNAVCSCFYLFIWTVN